MEPDQTPHLLHSSSSHHQSIFTASLPGSTPTSTTGSHSTTSSTYRIHFFKTTQRIAREQDNWSRDRVLGYSRGVLSSTAVHSVTEALKPFHQLVGENLNQLNKIVPQAWLVNRPHKLSMLRTLHEPHGPWIQLIFTQLWGSFICMRDETHLLLCKIIMLKSQ